MFRWWSSRASSARRVETPAAPVAPIDASAAAPVFEALEDRLLMSTTRIAVIGSSSVAGGDTRNSFRRPLYFRLQSGGYSINFVGSTNRNDASAPPNNDFDRDHNGYGGVRADQIIKGTTKDYGKVPKLADALAGKSTDGDDYTPDVAIIYVGHNDIFQGYSPESTLNDLRDIINVLQADNPNVVILLGKLHPSAWHEGSYNDELATLNGLMDGLAQSERTPDSPVVTVDLFTGWNPDVYTTDGQHANPDGEYWLATRFYNAMKPYLDTATEPGSVIVSPTAGLITSEDGQTASFTVKLSKRPSSNVTITFSSSDTSEGTIDKPVLTFTPNNWNDAQTITVIPVDDSSVDGSVTYSIVSGKAQSTDAAFQNASVADVKVTNTDNDKQPATIRGRIFNDANLNGSRDSNEGYLSGIRAYIDADLDGKRDAGELSDATDSDGRFTFSNLPEGTYVVRLDLPSGYWFSTGPGSAAQRVITVNWAANVATVFALTTKDPTPNPDPDPEPDPDDGAGQTPATAAVLPDVARQVVADRVSAGDRVDLYRIRIRKPSQLRVALRGLSADARVQLLTASGRRVRNSPGLTTTKRVIQAPQLRKGTYFVRVVSNDGLPTDYRLRLRRLQIG